MTTSSAPFTGCAAALVTPFTSSGSVDLPALKRLIKRQIDARMDAIVLLGTTGEPSTLTMDERSLVIKTGIEMINGAMPVIVGTGANDTSRAIEYARQAENLGAQGQLCVTPYYNKTTQPGLIRHFSKVADAAALPMLLYNVPSRTGMSISAQTAAELSLHPRIVGIKEASGDAALAADILHSAPQLTMYCGNDDMIVPLMALGAQGAISVCANIIPAQTKTITQACLDNRYDQARRDQLAWLSLIRSLFSQVNPIPVKAALAKMNLCEDILRLPLTSLEEPHRSRLLSILDEMNLI